MMMMMVFVLYQSHGTILDEISLSHLSSFYFLLLLLRVYSSTILFDGVVITLDWRVFGIFSR